ncbi:fungal-specific transcription factor domain-containing protein [Corynascus similis CBS 632.67]
MSSLSSFTRAAPESTPDVTERQQCWECRRRRLVCDGTQPVCTKCQAARIVCPGYADKKPLTWLAPGQVMSRTRRKKSPRPATSRTPQRKSSSNNRRTGQVSATVRDTATESDPSRALPTESQAHRAELVRPVELRPEVVDVFEALMYYNGHIFPKLLEDQLAPCAYVMPLVLVEGIPPSITHTLVSVVVSHRIMQMTEDPASDQLVKPMWNRLYRHRDIAVREIAQLVASEKKRKSRVTLVAVYTLFFAMLQQSFTPCWRTHIDAFMSLTNLWGGFSKVLRDMPELEMSMMAVFIVGVLANTTSPRDDQFRVASHSETLAIAEAYYTETYYPSVSLPRPLLTAIIEVNDLRTIVTASPSSEITTSALGLLSRIESFSPEAFAAAKPVAVRGKWRLLAEMYHATTFLYALLSLQSSGEGEEIESLLALARARHARRLFALLEEAAAEVPAVMKRATWSLVVAGVEAARAGRDVQRWVGARLDEMRRDQGMAPPRVARTVLERFWARGGGSWDECFTEPLCLVL